MSVGGAEPLPHEALDYLRQALDLAQEPVSNFEGALPLLVKAHEAGVPEATYAIGNWYFWGRYLEQDIPKAIAYWEVAAEQGNVDALTELAKYYELGEHEIPELPKALGLWMKAALLGGHGVDI